MHSKQLLLLAIRSNVYTRFDKTTVPQYIHTYMYMYIKVYTYCTLCVFARLCALHVPVRVCGMCMYLHACLCGLLHVGTYCVCACILVPVCVVCLCVCVHASCVSYVMKIASPTFAGKWCIRVWSDEFH